MDPEMIKFIGDTFAYPGRAWVECDPIAGTWHAALYYTDGTGVTAIGCACKPCETKGLFCKSCRTLKDHKKGNNESRFIRIVHPEEFGIFPEATPPPEGLARYAKWVSKYVMW